MSYRGSFLFLTSLLAAAPVFGGACTIAVTPEPSLGILAVLGVGAVVVLARKKKGR
jgi:hypothetical protein